MNFKPKSTGTRILVAVVVTVTAVGITAVPAIARDDGGDDDTTNDDGDGHVDETTNSVATTDHKNDNHRTTDYDNADSGG
jgi:hypothetical protein